MNEQELIIYYNKFNEDKRLDTRHGYIEFNTTIKYIKDYLKPNMKILEVGAGTGKYSGYLSNLGYDVSAVELIKHNLRLIEKNYPKVNSILGNAIDLSMFNDNTFDLVLLFGPMYHLPNKDDQIKALNEAKRVVKKDGIIMSIYIMNDYAILKHAFIDNYYLSNKDNINKDFKILSKDKDLYTYHRLEDIDELNKIVNLKRIKIISQDGPTDYFRKEINEMDEETLNAYLHFHQSTCEKKEMLGLSAHIIDILIKED